MDESIFDEIVNEKTNLKNQIWTRKKKPENFQFSGSGSQSWEFLFFDHFGFFNDDIFLRHIVMETPATGFDAGDIVDNGFAGDHFTENRIAPALGSGGGVI